MNGNALENTPQGVTMNRQLHDFFREVQRFPEATTNPLYLGHIAEFGWVLNEALLNHKKDTGLYLPTRSWKRRGEIAAAVIMTYMNIVYNHHDDFRHSLAWEVLLRSSHITAVTQFWRYRPFADIDINESIRLLNIFYDRAAHLHDDSEGLAVTVGRVGQELEEFESDAMVRFAGYTHGILRQMFL
jgi:hypothetical protein